MARIEWFEHTADIGMRVHADSPEELFQTAAEALFDLIVVDRQTVRPERSQPFTLAADTLADLLAVWLEELLFQFETTHVLFGSFLVTLELDPPRLKATALGEPIDRARHVLDHEVKAVTRHAMRLSQHAGHWSAELILDI